MTTKTKPAPPTPKSPTNPDAWAVGNTRYEVTRSPAGGGTLKAWRGGHMVRLDHCWTDDELTAAIQEAKRT